ncbi:cytochrome P460 family protein [Acidiphilium sp.]|uniref:cytochrome P460 family protein n=1 Tax=Acidiphilium sp. TaxID=527 RepID=UPI003CFD881C
MSPRFTPLALVALVTSGLIAPRLVEAATGAAPVPTPAQLWQQVHALQEHGKLLEGSHLYMFGSRMADYYTIDRANPPALAAAAKGVAAVKTFPAGSLLIKENFNDHKQLGTITAMLKLPGYDKQNRNWVMAMYKPDGTPMAFGKVDSCDKCHAIASASDFVFPPLRRLPPMLVLSFFPGQTMSPAYLKLLNQDQK